MNSMTAFGRGTARAAGCDIEVEIRSINHRYLAARLTLPDDLSRFESEVEAAVRQAVERGTVSVRVAVRRPPIPDPERAAARVKQIHATIEAMKKAVGQKGPVPFEALLTIPGFWSNIDDRGPMADVIWPAAKKALADALKQLQAGRAREGAQIAKDLLGRIAKILAVTKTIEKRAPLIVKQYEERLAARVKGVLESHGLDAAKADIAKEIAIFADRCDVTEEMSRLAFHSAKLKQVLGEKQPIGRKIEFLAQEMTREANTLASKSNDGEVSALAVEIKAEVEKIKEQAENVE